MCVNCRAKKQMTKKLLAFIWVAFFDPPVCFCAAKQYSDTLSFVKLKIEKIFFGFTEYQSQ